MTKRVPNFENLRRTLMRQGEPEYVPLVEFAVDQDVKNAFLGRPIASLKDEVEFWVEAGYDFIPLQAGIRTLFWPGATMAEKASDQGRQTRVEVHKKTQTKYTLYKNELRDMGWAEEKKGRISTMEEFESFPWPDPDEMDLSSFELVKQYMPPNMKVVACIGYIFTATWWLMGMETFCIALTEQPELVKRIYDRVWSIQSKVLLRILKLDSVGAIMHSDDIAYAEALMVSPRHLRENVFPWYRWSGTMVREAGLPYIYHSDGRLLPVLDDIVACGFNALHPIEPKAMDIVDVKRRVGDHLCLIGNLDLIYTLTRGTPQEVDDEVKERIRTVGPGGGYCVGSANSVTAYVPLENYNAMREAVFKYGRYPLSV